MLYSLISLLVGLFASHAQAQGPNTLAQYNPSLRTMSSNGTWFIVPVNATILQASIPYPLLSVPADNDTLFPNGFPDGMHPLLVANYYCNDIRMTVLSIIPLAINNLMSGEVYVPFVDRLKDGKTPFKFPLPVLIGGTNGDFTNAIIPVIVGSFEGPIVSLGVFDPDTAAWNEIGSGQYSAQGKAFILPNPVSGPSVAAAVYDMSFVSTANPLYTSSTFHSLMNQPIILPTGECLRNTNYFNDTFTNPVDRAGNVTLYGSPLPLDVFGVIAPIPSGIAGTYTGLGGYSAEGQTVGYNPEDCTSAAINLDPASLR